MYIWKNNIILGLLPKKEISIKGNIDYVSAHDKDKTENKQKSPLVSLIG